MQLSWFRYGLFLCLNSLVLGLILWFTFFDELSWFQFSMILTIVLLIVQYPLLNQTRNWWLKSLYFYLGMLAFLLGFGLFLSWDQSVGGAVAGSFSARLDGTLRITFFGHIFGLPFLPVVIAINYLLRKQLFNPVVK